jgi:hypothetical protein
MSEEKIWRHSRKGLIYGTIVSESEEWVNIELTAHHEPHLANRNTDPFREPGEILTARKSLLQELIQEPDGKLRRV